MSGQYVDQVSGAKDRRPELDRLMADAHRRLFDAVLVWSSIALAAHSAPRECHVGTGSPRYVAVENRRIRIYRKATKTNAGRRVIELNNAATAAIWKLYARARALGATEPEHYLLPADLSHTHKTDPLKGPRGFTVESHQMSWRMAWRNLREAAAKTIEDLAAKEHREIKAEERQTVALFRKLRFQDLRHTFITLMGERGAPTGRASNGRAHVVGDGSSLHAHQQPGSAGSR
jgi:integrase